MPELQNMLENKILKQLSIYHAIGEVKLFESVTPGDDAEGEQNKLFRNALTKLYKKGMIEVVYDKTNTMSVVRMINVLH